MKQEDLGSIPAQTKKKVYIYMMLFKRVSLSGFEVKFSMSNLVGCTRHQILRCLVFDIEDFETSM